MRFEWDPAKNRTNRDKHGLSFEDASKLFASGVDYLVVYDARHSEQEDRFIAIGPIRRGVVVVVYTEHQDDAVRIVSARMATKQERQRFQSYRRDSHG